MPSIVSLIEYEEGWREKPYLCSQGYPTVGYGFKVGPKGAPISQYQFRLPKPVGVVWLSGLIAELTESLGEHPAIGTALRSCDPARQAVLISMAYQMGVDGLAKFHGTLAAIELNNWELAAKCMIGSLWYKQTPARASRHAEQIRTGKWCGLYRD